LGEADVFEVCRGLQDTRQIQQEGKEQGVSGRKRNKEYKTDPAEEREQGVSGRNNE
jgi:hypothetical protein